MLAGYLVNQKATAKGKIKLLKAAGIGTRVSGVLQLKQLPIAETYHQGLSSESKSNKSDVKASENEEIIPPPKRSRLKKKASDHYRYLSMTLIHCLPSGHCVG